MGKAEGAVRWWHGATVLNLTMNFPFFFAEFTAQALSRSARSS